MENKGSRNHVLGKCPLYNNKDTYTRGHLPTKDKFISNKTCSNKMKILISKFPP